jgi:hypothetical protein
VAARQLQAGIDRVLLLGSRARHKDDARAVAGAHEGVSGAGRAVHEIPGLERPFLPLDEQQAFAREHEEVLLVGLGVVEPARLSGLEDLEREAELGELVRGEIGTAAKHGHAALEDASGAEGVIRQPRDVPDVDDEPAVAHRRKPGADFLELRIAHQLGRPR